MPIVREYGQLAQEQKGDEQPHERIVGGADGLFERTTRWRQTTVESDMLQHEQPIEQQGAARKPVHPGPAHRFTPLPKASHGAGRAHKDQSAPDSRNRNDGVR